MEKSVSRTIAEFALNLKYEDLPAEVIHEVKRYLYDSIGCAYGGYHTKDVNWLKEIYESKEKKNSKDKKTCSCRSD